MPKAKNHRILFLFLLFDTHKFIFFNFKASDNWRTFHECQQRRKKRIKRGIILMKYAAVHVLRESSMSICSRRSLPASEKNEDFSTLFVFLSQQNRRKKTFSADRVLSSSVNLPKASFMISENIKNIILDVACKPENKFQLINCVVRKINIYSKITHKQQ